MFSVNPSMISSICCGHSGDNGRLSSCDLLCCILFGATHGGTRHGRREREGTNTRTKTIKVILANSLGCCCSLGDDNVSVLMIYGRYRELSQFKVSEEIYERSR